jgi:hypothetical protein
LYFPLAVILFSGLGRSLGEESDRRIIADADSINRRAAQRTVPRTIAGAGVAKQMMTLGLMSSDLTVGIE